MKYRDRESKREFVEILYFDNHIVVVNKPAGIPTESQEEESLEDLVKEWVRKEFCKKGNVFLSAAHRLDKLVSGVVVFAKTSKALQRLHESFRTRQTQKTYLALVEGTVEQSSGLLENYLAREEFYSRVCSEQEKLAKKAILSYSVKGFFKKNSLLEIDLHTGRYHQIRAQLAHINHPVVNDRKYGAKSASSLSYIALHHHTLQIIHPISKEKLVFSVDLPDYWNLWMQQGSG